MTQAEQELTATLAALTEGQARVQVLFYVVLVLTLSSAVPSSSRDRIIAQLAANSTFL